MKLALLTATAASALALAACGGTSDSTSSVSQTAEPVVSASRTSQPEPGLATKTAGVRKQPQVTLPPGPPPKHLVVRRLKEGFGAAAHWGDRLYVQYVAVAYKTRKPFEIRWGSTAPFSFNFGSGEVRDGLETGLKGMKVGGRRELILPSRLAYGTGALLYVVELLAIEPD